MLGNMHWSTPPSRTLAMYVLAAAILSATYAAAIEQYRQTSSKPSFYVRIPGKNFFNLHKGQTLRVRCKAKGGHDIDDIPMISFYRQLADRKTIMPLSSSSYGVTIRAVGDRYHEEEPRMRSRLRRRKSSPKRHHRRVMKSTKILHLHKEIYEILDPGANRFYCRATTMSGAMSEDRFIINKI